MFRILTAYKESIKTTTSNKTEIIPFRDLKWEDGPCPKEIFILDHGVLKKFVEVDE